MATKEEQQKIKQAKQTDKLIAAVEKLQKQMVYEADEAKKLNGKFSFKQAIKDQLPSIKERVSEKFSMKGIAGMMGINEGGFIGSILGARDEHLKAKKAASAKQAEEAQFYAQTYVEANQGKKNSVTGEVLSDEELRKEGVKQHLEATYHKDRLDSLNKKKKAALETGIKGAGLTDKELEQYEESETKLKQFSGDIPNERPAQERLDKIAAFTHGNYKKSISGKDERLGLSEDEQDDLDDKQLYDIQKNLLKLSEQQLAALEKLADAAEGKKNPGPGLVTMPVMASDIKTKESVIPVKATATIVPQEEPELPSVAFTESNLPPVASTEPVKTTAKITTPGMPQKSIADILGNLSLDLDKEESTLETIAKNTAGPSEEDKLEKKAINPKSIEDKKEKNKEKKSGIESLFDLLKGGLGDITKFASGLKSLTPLLSTLGSGLALAAAAFAGFKVGEWLNEKFKLSDKVGNVVEGVQKLTGNQVDGTGAWGEKERIKAAKQILETSPDSGLKMSYDDAKLLEKEGIHVTSERIDQRTTPEAKAAKLAVSAKVEKPAESPRAVASENLDTAQNKKEELTEAKEKATIVAPTTIVNNNQSTNNTSKTTKISPPVRNLESSFNTRLASNYA